jgi:phosphatidate cytidylyltransferase
MLKLRVITGLILLLLVGLVFYVPYPLFFGFTGLVILIAAWEWSALMGLSSYMARAGYVLALMLSLWVATRAPIYLIVWISFGWWILALLWVIAYARGRLDIKNRFIQGVVGIVLLVPAWISFNTVRVAQNDVGTIFFILCIICGTDIGAYFVGRCFGKHPFAPKISPHKTWEGFWGGLLTAFCIAWIGCFTLSIDPPRWWRVILLSLLTAVFSVVGDLFESMVKRQAGVRDSGRLLPGHGGVLDRLDSIVAGFPIFLWGCFVWGLSTFIPQAKEFFIF